MKNLAFTNTLVVLIFARCLNAHTMNQKQKGKSGLRKRVKTMRLIDYNEIRKLFSEEYKKTAQLIRDGETHLDNLAEGFVEADRVIFKLPDVDAVEVVRCKDCQYYEPFATGCDEMVCGLDDLFRNPVDFCSNGERRSE